PRMVSLTGTPPVLMDASRFGDVAPHQFPEARALAFLGFQYLNEAFCLFLQRRDPGRAGREDLGLAKTREARRRLDREAPGPNQVGAGVRENEVGKIDAKTN